MVRKSREPPPRGERKVRVLLHLRGYQSQTQNADLTSMEGSLLPAKLKVKHYIGLEIRRPLNLHIG